MPEFSRYGGDSLIYSFSDPVKLFKPDVTVWRLNLASPFLLA
jgi:hypothetical protein